MILEPKKIKMAYRCAACGDTILGEAAGAGLSSDMTRLKCSCGGSAMTLKALPDDKVRVGLPCAFCQNDHTFVISRRLIFSRELFTYPCPYAGVDIAFFGEEESVNEAISVSDGQLSELFSDCEMQLMKSSRDGAAGSDEYLRGAITLVLGQMREEGKIYCDCGSPEELSLLNGDDYVEISCKRCGCRKRYFCMDFIATNDLFEADSVRLERTDVDDDAQ